MTTASIPTFNLTHAGQATRQLQEAAGNDDRAAQYAKAYLLLAKSRWQFDGRELRIESATKKPGTQRYRVVDGTCHCPGWNARLQCWHADAWQILITATQLAVPAPPRPRRTMAELDAAVADLY